MNRDAKIGIIVILIIVVLLFIIWGRSERVDDEMALGPGPEDTVAERANRIDASTAPGSTLDQGVRAASPEGGAHVVSDDLLALPVESTTAEPARPEPAPSPPPTPEPKPKVWYYTVAFGDSLGLIAREQLSDQKRWEEIAELNNLRKPYRIRIGRKLKMPAKEAGPAVEAAPPATPSGTRVYVVKDGDSLIQIARAELRDATKWKKVAELNHLTEPYRIKVGQVLLLPE